MWTRNTGPLEVALLTNCIHDVEPTMGIFIKPLPRYPLSHAFCDRFLSEDIDPTWSPSRFAVVSTLWNSMQVVLAVEEVLPARWVSLWLVCRWFSTVSLVLTALISVWIALLWLWMILDEWVFACRSRQRMRHASAGGTRYKGLAHVL